MSLFKVGNKPEIVCGFADPCGTSFTVQLRDTEGLKFVMFESGDTHQSRELAIAFGKWVNGLPFDPPMAIKSAHRDASRIIIEYESGDGCSVSIDGDLADSFLSILPDDLRWKGGL